MIAVINCNEVTIRGATNNVPVAAFAEFFATLPITSPNWGEAINPDAKMVPADIEALMETGESVSSAKSRLTEKFKAEINALNNRRMLGREVSGHGLHVRVRQRARNRLHDRACARARLEHGQCVGDVICVLPGEAGRCYRHGTFAPGSVTSGAGSDQPVTWGDRCRIGDRRGNTKERANR